jgi:hypothetical protein
LFVCRRTELKKLVSVRLGRWFFFKLFFTLDIPLDDTVSGRNESNNNIISQRKPKQNKNLAWDEENHWVSWDIINSFLEIGKKRKVCGFFGGSVGLRQTNIFLCLSGFGRAYSGSMNNKLTGSLS